MLKAQHKDQWINLFGMIYKNITKNKGQVNYKKRLNIALEYLDDNK